MSDLKVEGKVADFCPKCKNCKSTTRECDGEKDWLTEVECEDPYDGMIKTLAADSDICCSVFTPKPDHGRYSWGKDKNENDSMYSELIKASKRKDDLIQNYREKLKKADDEINLLNSKVDKLGEYYRTDEKLIDNIQKVIFPQEEGSDYTYSYEEILNKVKDLKVQSDENGTMYEDLKYWKERCHKAETDVTTLNSKVEVLEKKFRKADSIRDAVWNESELKQKISELTESNENLKKAVERRDRWVEDLKGDIDTLQNECLVIADIAKRAYDESIKIKEENDE